jgi:hypothetical protein
MLDRKSVAHALIAACAIACTIALTLAYDAGLGRDPKAAEAVPVPRTIGPRSTVTEILRFAETSSSRWRSLRVSGHQGAPGATSRFDTWVERPGRSRTDEGGIVRVRDGAESVRLDRTSKRAVRGRSRAAADEAMNERMAVHRANDPTLTRDGELLVDTPVNNLLSPAWLVRKELGMAATSVVKRGAATVAGRETVVLEVRFPAELAKEDHWDVYVDVKTGILLGMVIEPLPGETRFESFVDIVETDAPIDPAIFDTAVPQGFAEGTQ